MSYFLAHPELFDRPLRLGKEERNDPFEVLENFFRDYPLSDCREQLWNMMETCLTTDNTAFGEAEERDMLLQYYKDLESMIEATWLISNHRLEYQLIPKV
jgi:hypothetical protein